MKFIYLTIAIFVLILSSFQSIGATTINREPDSISDRKDDPIIKSDQYDVNVCSALKKDWIDILAALLTPTIAIFGIYLGIRNYKLTVRKRKDDLFDRRYKFLKDFERLWKSTGLESEGATMPNLEWDDLEPWIQEARFLFGKDIAEHIKSYERKSYQGGLHWVPDTELYRPFNKYLCFEDE